MKTQVVPAGGETTTARGAVRLYYLDWLRVLAILTVFVYHSTRFFNLEDWHVKNPTWYPAVEVWNVFAGTWILNFSTPFLTYASEAVLPFYILHQTVLLSVGYFVVQWPIPDLLKWAIILPASLAIIMMIYEFLIRRFNVMRFLFGLKPLRKQPAARSR